MPPPFNLLHLMHAFVTGDEVISEISGRCTDRLSATHAIKRQKQVEYQEQLRVDRELAHERDRAREESHGSNTKENLFMAPSHSKAEVQPDSVKSKRAAQAKYRAQSDGLEASFACTTRF